MREVTQTRLEELIVKCRAIFSADEVHALLATHTKIVRRNRLVYERRALWAALHNRLNLGHPKGPRKLHPWTLK